MYPILGMYIDVKSVEFVINGVGQWASQMDVSDRGAEVLVQLISPEEFPVCECLHHEEQRKLTESTSKKRSSSADSQQGVLLFLRSWHPPYFIFFVSVLEVRQGPAN